MKDVAIIGAGICGAAVAYYLAEYLLDVCVIERCDDVAKGTTRANSAIIHAGYDPESETLMAKSNVRGNILAGEICERLGVDFKRIGSLVLAFSDDDLKTLETLYERGVENGVPDMKILSKEETLAKEPKLSGEVAGALYAPTAGIVNPWQYCIAMSNFAYKNGVQFLFNSPVTRIEKIDGGYKITAGENTVEAKYIVSAAGVHCDEINRLVGLDEFNVRVVRGEYYLLDKSQGSLVSSVVFQCPSSVGKGVLVSPTVHGNLIVGPNAEEISDKDDVATTLVGQDAVRALAVKTSPNVSFRDNIRNFAGNRCYIQSHDFVVEESKTAKGFINMAGIKSPGLSSAPALAERVVEILKACGLELKKKNEIKEYKYPVLLRDLSGAEQAKRIAENPRFARVICRCETITEGDIVTALGDGFTPATISAVKRRCNAGMGRCQGGFCSMRVHEIIANERGITPEEVTLDGGNSYIVTGDTKEVL